MGGEGKGKRKLEWDYIEQKCMFIQCKLKSIYHAFKRDKSRLRDPWGLEDREGTISAMFPSLRAVPCLAYSPSPAVSTSSCGFSATYFLTLSSHRYFRICFLSALIPICNFLVDTLSCWMPVSKLQLTDLL